MQTALTLFLSVVLSCRGLAQIGEPEQEHVPGRDVDPLRGGFTLPDPTGRTRSDHPRSIAHVGDSVFVLREASILRLPMTLAAATGEFAAPPGTCALARAGERLASIDAEGNVSFLDPVTGEVHARKRLPPWPRGAAASPRTLDLHGSRLTVTTGTRALSLDVDAAEPTWEELAGVEWDASGALAVAPRDATIVAADRGTLRWHAVDSGRTTHLQALPPHTVAVAATTDTPLAIVAASARGGPYRVVRVTTPRLPALQLEILVDASGDGDRVRRPPDDRVVSWRLGGKVCTTLADLEATVRQRMAERTFAVLLAPGDGALYGAVAEVIELTRRVAPDATLAFAWSKRR